MVLLANLGNEIDAVLATDREGELKENLLDEIRVTHEKRWPADDILGYRALPMWGESSQTPVISKNTLPSDFGGAIPMLRSVARVQIGVSIAQENGTSSDGTDFFELLEVKVYNARKEGYAVPLDGNYSLLDGKVIAPSLVASSVIHTPETMSYVLNDIDPDHSNRLSRTIYLNEAENVGQEAEDALFLILKAYYTGDGETTKNTTTPSYYRVDFLNSLDERIDILRNHTYNINITGINGPGYEDEETAVKSIPLHLETSITDWSNGEMSDVVFNGQYYLSVTQSYFSVPKDEESYTFGVKTNYPKGWTARVDDASPWITITDPAPAESDQLDQIVNLTFHMEENDTEDDRTGSIFISCGTTLEMEIVIDQTTKEARKGNGSLTIREYSFTNGTIGEEIDELVFSSFYRVMDGAYTNPNSAILQWEPTEEDVIFYVEPSADLEIRYYQTNPNIGTISLSGINTASGGQLITHFYMNMFTAEDIDEDPFKEKSMTFYFTLLDEEPIHKPLTLRQVHWNLIADTRDDYVLDGAYSNFTVRSNCDWTAVVLQDDDNIIEDILTPSGQKSKAGRLFQFKLANKPTLTTASATFQFTYYGEDGLKRTEDVTINVGTSSTGTKTGGEANCYLLQPGGEGVAIPVSQANKGGGNPISSGEKLNWKFLWTDNPNGMGANGAVSQVELEGTGPDAILKVYPGSQSGNSVVAVTNESGTEIYWSWHLWVTDYDPDVNWHDYRYYEFLDRNLGALSGDPSTPEFRGLYYQWGRKDPFPGPRSVNANTFIPIYDETGKQIHSDLTKIPSESYNYGYGSGGNSLKLAIQNPMTFYRTTGECWFTDDYVQIQSNVMAEFWSMGSDLSQAQKGVYDPCPDGWKVVPGSTNNASEWYTLLGQSVYNSNTLCSTVSSQKEGQFEAETLGDWPLGGYIAHTSGSLSSVGSDGSYWTANLISSGATGIRFVLSTSQGQAGQGGSRGRANSIRCMRRK